MRILLTILLSHVMMSCSSQEPVEIIYGTKIGSHKPKSEISRKKFGTESAELSTSLEEKNNNFLKIHEEADDPKYIDEDYNIKSGSSTSSRSTTSNHSNAIDAELSTIDTASQDNSAYDHRKNPAISQNREYLAKQSGVTIKPGSAGKNQNPRVGAGNQKNQEGAPDHKALSTQATPSNQNTFTLIAPVSGTIISRFGEVVDGSKTQGINFSAKAGAPVRASYDGVVVATGKDTKFGYRIIIKHDSIGIQSAYAHLGKIAVSKGQIVRKGEEIGSVGQIGESPAMHFAVRKDNAIVDPMPFLK